ncbi:hypothetical protein SO694_00192025 [Aureococcus anophagefferens]|uniref:Uncharacterized protein n=1 Tax=Aureococcus anophagefferens TaxID=44056 RepID=A0ABR1FNW7_AURAN
MRAARLALCCVAAASAKIGRIAAHGFVKGGQCRSAPLGRGTEAERAALEAARAAKAELDAENRLRRDSHRSWERRDNGTDRANATGGRAAPRRRDHPRSKDHPTDAKHVEESSKFRAGKSHGAHEAITAHVYAKARRALEALDPVVRDVFQRAAAPCFVFNDTGPAKRQWCHASVMSTQELVCD